ncbi:MAG TPA: DUF5808 domain-containing protein [Vicinamibacterales bacterium]|nr:DUF5808 domain-containing protein [Vicinamibacterales bacterium]
MTSQTWLLLAVTGIDAVLFHALPFFSRPDIVFSVTVADTFAAGSAAATLVRRYRTAVWIGAAAAAAGLLLVQSTEIGVGLLLAQGMLGVAAWLWARGQAQPHAASPPTVRTATIEPRQTRLPGGALFALGPLLVVAAAVSFLCWNWEAIPDRMPVRWSFDGAATGWRVKSIAGVYSALGMATVIIVIMLVMAWLLVHRTRQVAITDAAAGPERRFKAVSALQLLLSAYGLAALSTAFSVAPVLTGANRMSPAIPALIAAAVIVSLGCVLILARLGQGGHRAVAPRMNADARGDATPDAAWKGGLVYFNPNDPALLVEKRLGLGWTLNLANKWSWVLVGTVVALALLLRLLR